MPFKDPVKTKAYAQAYRLKRKVLYGARDRAYNKAWVKAHPNNVARIQKRYTQRHPARVLLHRARARAKIYNIKFTITEADIKIPQFCPLLNIKLQRDGIKDYAPSLDRINPKQGYTPNNIHIISWRANKIKSNATLEELITMGKAAAKLKGK